MQSPAGLINPDENEPMKARLGRCYELSGMLVLNNPGPGITLVHGSIQGMGRPRIEHAWVELADGSVWEPATNQCWERQRFDSFFSAQVAMRYDFTTAMRRAVHHEHWGPWTGELPEEAAA
jgi:hypothetical protein